MLSKNQKIQALKTYFEQQPEVVLAFLFGSRAENKTRSFSDWDIAVYFHPYQYMETETRKDYPAEKKIWRDLIQLCQTDNVDFLVLNRARPDLVFHILDQAAVLSIKNRRLYLDLLSKTHYDALDWQQFVFDFCAIRERSTSLSDQDKKSILDYLIFLEEEFKELEQFKQFTWNDYRTNSLKRKAIERWVENIAMACIDIAKIILASDKKRIPQTYQEALKTFAAFYIKDWSEEKANTFSDFAKLRNIVVHEYLDIKWQRIKNFIQDGERLYPSFIAKVKEIVNQNN